MTPSYPASTMPQPMFPPPSLPSSYQHSGHPAPDVSAGVGSTSSLPPISPMTESHPHHHSHGQYPHAQHAPSSQYPPPPHPVQVHASHQPPPVIHQSSHHGHIHAPPSLQQLRPLSQPTRQDAQSAPPPPGPANAPSSKNASDQVALASVSQIDNATGWKYQLDVVQQPKRARMCGFGDKDRRPVTPPPCVRLIITDAATGKKINCNDIDHAMFVLNVDLWSADGGREVNLVRSSSSSASSSAIPNTTSPIGSAPDPNMGYYTTHAAPFSRDAYGQQVVAYGQDYQMQSAYSMGQNPYTPNGSYGASQQYLSYPPAYNQEQPAPTHPRSGSTSSVSQTRGMFTRNLIGSVAVSAFRLNDDDDEPGIWFVLQDLSVRTEGTFRLRFSFVDVSPRATHPGDGIPKVNTGRAPTLASSFSETFNVFSAKKFPGVCESTPLSKTFAAQGIKIPIRKDASGKDDDDDAYMD